MTGSDDAAVLVAGPPIEEREDRMATGADELSTRKVTILSHPQFLVGASAALVTTGLSVILLGWFGASHSTLIEEQVPYLISGGLLGLALAVIGALLFFAHWLTVLVRENRAQEAVRSHQHAELMEALRALRESAPPQEESNGTARGAQRARPIRGTPGST